MRIKLRVCMPIEGSNGLRIFFKKLWPTEELHNVGLQCPTIHSLTTQGSFAVCARSVIFSGLNSYILILDGSVSDKQGDLRRQISDECSLRSAERPGWLALPRQMLQPATGSISALPSVAAMLQCCCFC